MKKTIILLLAMCISVAASANGDSSVCLVVKKTNDRAAVVDGRVIQIGDTLRSLNIVWSKPDGVIEGYDVLNRRTRQVGAFNQNNAGESNKFVSIINTSIRSTDMSSAVGMSTRGSLGDDYCDIYVPATIYLFDEFAIETECKEVSHSKFVLQFSLADNVQTVELNTYRRSIVLDRNTIYKNVALEPIVADLYRVIYDGKDVATELMAKGINIIPVVD